MARSRNLKPSFFQNENLAALGPMAMLLFEGLWCHADREGRLEDRPARIKIQVLPYFEADCNLLLTSLEKAGFITRYEVEGRKYIQVLNFVKHQNPHIKESSSTIPAPDISGASTGNTGTSPADSLNPLTDSLKPLPMPEQAQAVEGLCVATWQQWVDYRKQIHKPLKPASIPAAQKAMAAFGSDQEAVVQQSIANGYQGLFPLKSGGSNATRQPADNSAVGKVRAANERARQREAADRQPDAPGVGTNGSHVRPPLD